MQSGKRVYLGVAAVGALGACVAVGLRTQAIPRLLTRAKSEMMRKMMARMGEGCCDHSMGGDNGVRCGVDRKGEQPEPNAAASAKCGCVTPSTAYESTEPEAA